MLQGHTGESFTPYAVQIPAIGEAFKSETYRSVHGCAAHAPE